MRSMLGFTSPALIALSLCLGTIAVAVAQDEPPPEEIAVAGCNFPPDPFGGLVCKNVLCGRRAGIPFPVKLFCIRIIWKDPVTGLPTGLVTCECR